MTNPIVSQDKRKFIIKIAYIAFVAFLIYITYVKENPPPPQKKPTGFAISFGGPHDDYIDDIAFDASGNIYTVGCFNKIADFDPGIYDKILQSKDGQGVFISKLDKGGKLLWVRTFSGKRFNEKISIEIDSQGDPYILGVFIDTIDIDPGPNVVELTAKSERDVVLVKLDSDGNYNWSKQFGQEGRNKPGGLATDKKGHVYMAWAPINPHLYHGNFVEKLGVEYDRTAANILKFKRDGEKIWHHEFKYEGELNVSNASPTKIQMGEDENIYIIGEIMGKINLAPEQGNTHQLTTYERTPNGFVCKMSSDGTVLMTTHFGNHIKIDLHDISIDSKGDMYLTGTLKLGVANLNFNNKPKFTEIKDIQDLHAPIEEDIFILKVDSVGNFLWCNQIGGRFRDRWSSIEIDSSDNIYIAGGLIDTASFKSVDESNWTELSYEISGAFYAQLDSQGYYLWVQDLNVGPTGYGTTNAFAPLIFLKLDPQDNLYIGGSISQETTLTLVNKEYPLENAGNDEAFLVKILAGTIK